MTKNALVTSIPAYNSLFLGAKTEMGRGKALPKLSLKYQTIAARPV